MPARSNPFQKLILRIHEQLAPVGIDVTVEESGFTEEPSSGAPRETDVKIVMQTPNGTERTEGLLHAFKGEKLEKIETTFFDSAKDDVAKA